MLNVNSAIKSYTCIMAKVSLSEEWMKIPGYGNDNCILQAEKLQICVDATVDTYKVVPDALIEALSEQNLVLAKEEVYTLKLTD